MIVTLTPNPALDVTYRVEALEPATVHRVARGAVRAGGKGVNVARVLVEAGERALAIVPVGGAEGARLRGDLERSAVPHVAVEVGAPTRTTVTIVDAAGATALHEEGESPGDDGLAALEHAVRDALPRASALVVSGSLPRGVDAAWPSTLVAAAHAHDVPVIADLAGAALLAAAAAGADVVKPNRDELREATGIDDPLLAATALHERGAGLVVASLGAEGMVAVGDEVVRARLDEPVSGNPTGAGDAAVAALASSFGTPLAARVRRAVAWSAAAVAQPLAGSIGDAAPFLERVRREG